MSKWEIVPVVNVVSMNLDLKQATTGKIYILDYITGLLKLNLFQLLILILDYSVSETLNTYACINTVIISGTSQLIVAYTPNPQ